MSNRSNVFAGLSLFDSLESRVLLSSEPGVVMWHGAELPVVKGSWLINFEEAQSQQDGVLRTMEALASVGAVADSIRLIGLGYTAVFHTNAHLTQATVEKALELNDGVKSIEPDAVMSVAQLPNDPQFNQQYGLDNTGQFIPTFGFGVADADIDAPEAWDITIGSRDVIVAVIDTGVDLQHPDLAANIWVNPGEAAGNGIDDDGNGFVDDINGWDFGELDSNPDDVHGHGTAVAGVIGAVGDNGLGVSGVAWNVSIIAMKIANSFGGLSTSAIVSSHDYLTMMINLGHNIVASNNSYGGFNSAFYAMAPTGFSAERDAIERFIDAGGTFVAAAGNDGFDNDNPQFTAFPATYDIPGLIAVAATDGFDALAEFSNYGAMSVDLGAPGVQVYTTGNGGTYGFIDGTSFASPMVAGAVALLKTYRPNASPVEVREALLNSTDPLATLQGKVVSGGRLNVARALQVIGLQGPLVRSVTPGPIAPAPAADITVEFSKALDPAFIDAVHVSLVGPNGAVGIDTVELDGAGTRVTVTPDAELVAGSYTLTLSPLGFRDLSGNFLNGGPASGNPEVYAFQLAAPGTKFESNDTILTATPVAFSAAGTASFENLTIGDGLYGALDVDIFRITMPRGGLITADVDARALLNPSSLDSYLRLFNALGEELHFNDQFDGSDSFIDYFVTTGGSYYVAVSGFPNATYDPTLGGSGIAQSRGTYNLSLTIDLVDDDNLNTTANIPSPVTIPDQGNAIESVINITDARIILDANVLVTIDHDFVGDLRVTLISPQGTQTVLMNQNGGNGAFQPNPSTPVPARFDDEASVPITTAPPPFGAGVFRPVQALSRFDGQSALGNWRIRIEDLASGNTGQFIGWTLQLQLQNDIFGPFELNDTLTTARSITEINGAGVATRTAALGDGGFGNRDVDIFSFTVNAGATLSATLASGGSINGALRLFDSAGVEVRSNNPDGSLSASIQDIIVVDAGVYYIAASEANNVAYDPFVAGSGQTAVTTGNYTLTISVADGVSDGAVDLIGNNLALGLGSNGTFGSGSIGLEFSNIDFLYNSAAANPGADAFFGLIASGYSFKNDGAGGDPDLPMSITVQSDFANRRAVAEGVFRGIRVERAISFGVSDGFLVVDVTLTNTTSSLLTDVAWMEVFNPQQGINTPLPSFNTSNDVLDGSPFVSASFASSAFPQGLTIALAAPHFDTRAGATVVSGLDDTIRDPERLLSYGVNDPDGALADDQLGLTFDVGLVNPGQSATMRYFIMMGSTQASVINAYTDLNSGAGLGHLTVNPSTPANDPDGIVSLPYVAYYPEGYANDRASTFVPIVNPNAVPTRVVVIARYETGDRDQVIFDEVTPANSRGGFTITTPQMYADNTLLVRKDTPYALEIRSSLPVAATMSHYDFTGSTGESFTSVTGNTWTFANITKSPENFDFLVFYNPSDATVKVTTTLYRTGGGTPIVLNTELGAKRRGGWNFNAETGIPDGVFAAVVTSPSQLIAARTRFSADLGGSGQLGLAGAGATSGAVPTGQFGINATEETISVLNTNNQAAEVVFNFNLDNGESYRYTAVIAARSRDGFNLSSLTGFPSGFPYAIVFTSNLAVSVDSTSNAFGDSESSAFSPLAWSYWGFAEGFRPAGELNTDVTEILKVYNPSEEDQLIEVKVRFTDGQTETVRQVVSAGLITTFNVHDFIQGVRRQTDQFYSITVKGALPIVAFFDHSDNFFPGAFGLLGTPLGISSPV